MHWRDRVILAFCRVEPAGLSPVMPGTCGSLVAAVLAPFVFMPLSFYGRAAALAALFVAGSIASTRAARLLGKKDPGEVVIDEVLGQWMTYAPFAALSWPGLFAGFVLFRLFDMTKPWPIKASEDWLPGGYGIMIDDALAAVYAVPCLWVLRMLLPL
ncbi:Phosphatidylglycerophosphatase A [uncultured delta proteobacterium]|uniref:Phosphatidylglycerophosphatase A n=1 Tax=uncultured delta proteobacterium TaxID=34034 RepID=A0A212KB10_9DELT|nr:Phosphatidylglycerophosphatase A [uncultured delta proteobacterium]